MKIPITRIWHGKTNSIYKDEYLEYLEETGVKDLRMIDGNLSAEILRRVEGEVCHFWVISVWENIESIQKFAGVEIEKARYYEGDIKYLLEFEDEVIHCETFKY